jgi:carbon-monoxide dehydrogenase medium subunit
MKPHPFDYVAPETLDGALDLLARVGDDAVIIAGGQSLVPILNLRLARPELVIDLRHVTELARFDISEKGLRAGAMANALEVEEHPETHLVPGLHGALCQIAHPQIRSRTTIGGSVAHADPAAELPALLLALGGDIVLQSMARGKRTVSADDFFTGPMMTVREPDELLISVWFPAYPGPVAVLEVAKRPGDFALVGAVVGYAIADGVISDPRIALFGVSGRPVRMTSAEATLLGAIPNADTFQTAVEQLRDEVDSRTDTYATGEYRRQVAGTLVARALASLS